MKNATKEERKILYTKLYDELYERVPHHPQLNRKFNLELQSKAIQSQIKLLLSFFSSEKIFMELGAGDCALSFELCKYFKKVYAIDVSEKITNNHKKPINFELILSDGSSIDVPPETINIAYSNQLMEHLHPEDAKEQLRGIYNSLVHGGVYICLTPHKFMGPVDISKYFDNVATGFHLKEYTNEELFKLLKSVGFRKVQSFFCMKGICLKIPIYPSIIIEFLIRHLPYSLRKKISKTLLIRHLLSIRLIATK